MEFTESDIEDFLEAYIETALWAETDNSDESGGSPLDDNYSMDDIEENSLQKMRQECVNFLDEMAKQLPNVEDFLQKFPLTTIAHDFWLTKGGHGAGFWDGDYPEIEGEILTKLSKSFGEQYIFVGDDNQLYVS